MRYEVSSSGVPVLLLDSISEILPEDENRIVVAGSHGSQNVPRYALSVPLRGAVFNDAGIGKDQAGVASFAILSSNGLPAVAVSHNTARIGDARDVYEHGVISVANQLATEIGAAPGMTVADYIALLAAAR
jgi:hypothetical protein